MIYTKDEFKKEWKKENCKITFDDCRESLSSWTGNRISFNVLQQRVAKRCLLLVGLEKDAEKYFPD